MIKRLSMLGLRFSAIIFIAAIAIGCFIIPTPSNGEKIIRGEELIIDIEPDPSYVPSAPISIDGNANLQSSPSVSGNGTISNPYKISNFIIDCSGQSYGIMVMNVDIHFISNYMCECGLAQSRWPIEEYMLKCLISLPGSRNEDGQVLFDLFLTDQLIYSLRAQRRIDAIFHPSVWIEQSRFRINHSMIIHACRMRESDL